MSESLLKSDLTEAQIEFITSNTDFDRETCLKWFTQFKLQCPELVLDKPKFIQFYSQLIPGETGKAKLEFCGHVFEAVDTDRNGHVDFGEFLVAFWVRAKADMR